MEVGGGKVRAEKGDKKGQRGINVRLPQVFLLHLQFMEMYGVDQV